jgi:hypothetical protein
LIRDEVTTILKKFADCFFVMRQEKGRDVVLLCPVGDLPAFFENVMDEFGIVSFMLPSGALTFSADEAIADKSLEIRLSGSGTMEAEIKNISEKYNGLIY